jgi:hypothetical protein
LNLEALFLMLRDFEIEFKVCEPRAKQMLKDI